MNKQDTTLLSTLVLIGIILGAVGTVALYNIPDTDPVVSTDDSKVKGFVTYRLKRAGETEWTLLDANPNAVTKWGQQEVMQHMAFGNSTLDANTYNNGYVALGAEDNTTIYSARLESEVAANNLSRTTGAGEYIPVVSAINGTAYQVVFTFKASGTQTVNMSSLHPSGTTIVDDMFAYNTFTEVTLNDDDRLEITWEIDVS